MAETEIHVSQISPGTAYQLIGTNSGATKDVYLSLAGTTHQVGVGTAGTTITLSTPQNIDTTSSPTFQDLTLTDSSATTLDLTGGGGITLTSNTPANGGSISLTGTGSGHGDINMAKLTASTAMVTDASKNLASSATTATELGYVSGVTSAIQTQLNAKAPIASPTFTGTVTAPVVDITNTTNQLVLGTTNTTTISSTAPSASRTYTIPDAGSAANFVLDAGNYTIGGTWSFSNSITLASSKALILTDNSTNTVTVKATNSTTSYTLSLPTTAGTSNYFLQTDGSGNTTWASGGSGTISSGTSGQNAVYTGTTTIGSGATMSMNSTKITNLANGTAATDAAAHGQIGLLQTVQATYATQATTTSGSYADTGITISITPKVSTSHILLDFDIPLSLTGTSGAGAPTADLIITDSSNATIQEYLAVYDINEGITQPDGATMIHIRAWDAPGSTSSKTYKVRFRVNANSGSGTNTVRTCHSGFGQSTAFFTAEERQ